MKSRTRRDRGRRPLDPSGMLKGGKRSSRQPKGRRPCSKTCCARRLCTHGRRPRDWRTRRRRRRTDKK